MAAPDTHRRQQQNTNLLLMLLVFNFAFLYFMNQQKQGTNPRRLAKPPSFPADLREAIKVEGGSPAQAKQEALKLVAQAQEFAHADDFAGYAWLRAGTLVAERLEESDAAKVYNAAFPPRSEADKLLSISPREAGAKLINQVLALHSKSRFLAQASLQQALVLTPTRGGPDKQAVGAWETARTNKQLTHQPVYLARADTFVTTTIDDEACRQLDSYYRSGFLYRWLDFLVGLTGRHRNFSHALAVILFGIAVKVFMYPLTQKQMESFKAMAELSPQMKLIQDKYKDNKDPEKLRKMNQEMSDVYKRGGANPMVGCLLVLLQLPIFLVMYQTISHYQCQFRQASFLWIPSLAQPDTTLLIVYTVSMIFQGLTMQKPTTDPQQAMTQKMMTWFMPIFFAAMMYSWHFPSAFAIYWLTFNVFAIVQQWKTMHPNDRSNFSFRQHGVKGVVKRLVTPPSATQTPPKPPPADTNGSEASPPAAAANGGGQAKPRARRGKGGRKRST